VKRISALFEKYLSSLFQEFPKHCIRDLTQKDTPITIFMKDSFLEGVPQKDRPWFKKFLETQIFSQYCDQRLRSADYSKE